MTEILLGVLSWISTGPPNLFHICMVISNFTKVSQFPILQTAISFSVDFITFNLAVNKNWN